MTLSIHTRAARRAPFYASLTAIAASLALAGCSEGDDSSDPSSSADAPTAVTMQGVVTGSNYKPGSTANPTIDAAYFQNAKVCIDANTNGKCDPAENPVVTDNNGAFSLQAPAVSPLLADIGTDATNTASGTKVARRMALRISAEQIQDQGAGKIVVSPMSSEIQRMVEDDNSTYAAEKANLAARLNVQPADVIVGVHATQGGTALAAVRGQPAGQSLHLRHDQAGSRRPVSRRAGGAGRRSGTEQQDQRDARDGRHARDPQAGHLPAGAAGRVQCGRHTALRPSVRAVPGKQEVPTRS